MYSHTSVTTRPNAPNHSMYLGAHASAPDSMKSKSSTRLSAATTTTTALKPIPSRQLSWMKPIEWPKTPITMLARYSRSEEHTSELTSLLRISYADFCLKKQTHIENNHNNLLTKP